MWLCCVELKDLWKDILLQSLNSIYGMMDVPTYTKKKQQLQQKTKNHFIVAPCPI